jgi:CBS domain containing-hemolysin-like protein
LFELLHFFGQGRSHLAVVCEEPDNRIVGVIAMEDVIEELIQVTERERERERRERERQRERERERERDRERETERERERERDINTHTHNICMKSQQILPPILFELLTIKKKRRKFLMKPTTWPK